MFWEEWNHPDDVPSGGGRRGSKIVWGEWNHPSRHTHVNLGCVGRCARSEAGLRNDINSNCLAPITVLVQPSLAHSAMAIPQNKRNGTHTKVRCLPRLF